MIERLAVIGVGLIGGSLALALRAAGQVGEVVGAGRGRANLEQAKALGIIDRFTTSAALAVADADVVVVAAPLGNSARILHEIAPVLPAHAVVTDVGSTKRQVVDEARAALGVHFARFVPGHPIAGTEHSGAQAAFATLYRQHRVILTPLPETDAEALARVHAMWTATGATLTQMEVDEHDRVLAATSHLPHLLAYTLVDMLAAAADAQDIFAFAAGGFRDFTRIASSNPEMWRDITLANRDALLAITGQYQRALEDLMSALTVRDGERIEAIFRRAKHARDACALPEANAERR
jgi:prephenate dehydrogenase